MERGLRDLIAQAPGEEFRGELTTPDASESDRVRDPVALAESISQFAKLKKQTHGYIYVDRDRELRERRGETQGILSGGEIKSGAERFNHSIFDADKA